MATLTKFQSWLRPNAIVNSAVCLITVQDDEATTKGADSREQTGKSLSGKAYRVLRGSL